MVFWYRTFWLRTFIKQKVPYRNCNFTVQSQIFIAPIKYDRFIKKIFKYKTSGRFALSLKTSIAIQIQCKVNLIYGIRTDLISEYIILINNSFQIDSDVCLIEIFDCKKLHQIFFQVCKILYYYSFSFTLPFQQQVQAKQENLQIKFDDIINEDYKIQSNSQGQKSQNKQNKKRMKELKKVGAYHIFLNQVLGEGTFAKTYRAYRDKDKQTIYACKSINKEKIEKEFNNTAYIIKRIQQEFQVLQSLKHENIINFQDSQETKNNIYLFLEYCPNGTLREYINNHRFAHDKQEEISIIKQIIEGCCYLEEKGVMHRDIKPQNILLKGAVVKIADFGLAKLLNQENQSYKSTVVGTKHYMAPQILKQSKTKQTIKCDVWSVGITIYEILTGYLPFQMSDKIQSPHKILQLLQKKSQQDWSEIKDSMMRTLIFKMLIVDPNKRITFKNAKQVIQMFSIQN